MELSMARNERDKLVKEHARLLRRKTQIDRRLPEIEKEMDDLLEQAHKKAAEIRGESGVPIEIKNVGHGGRPEMVLEY
jgi:regulator of protease activity HflC (stomatin/prohibitin superfamily)